MTRGLCAIHYSQWHKRGQDFSQLTRIGCTERKARLARERYAALSESEKVAYVAKFQNSGKRPRDEQWRRRLSESQRARWEVDGSRVAERKCRGCDLPFMPNSGHHFWCTKQCFNTKRRCDARGITMRQYMGMLEAQDRKCALCGKEWHGFNKSKSLVIDHCHETGKVRGLLCGDCNTALGRFGDDPDRMRTAIAYLERGL